MGNPTHYGDPLAQQGEEPLSEMVIRFVPLDLVMQWRRCGMIADFLADFLAYNFEHKDTARNVISTVLNELLENAVKFSPEKHRRASLALIYQGSTIRIQTRNTSNKKHVASLRRLVERLCSEDADLLFLEQLEYSATEDQEASGLGIVTLKKDYFARIAVELSEPDDPPAASNGEEDDELINVQVTMELDVEELDRE
ncbi:MAG: hypothetical protein H6713_11960 [Myxococcales bacterium]|nr:hypothetical protein [Myxococcales bacterium]MCB9750691.1 hypothetical protein [Myxococcales bacterium]